MAAADGRWFVQCNAADAMLSAWAAFCRRQTGEDTIVSLKLRLSFAAAKPEVFVEGRCEVQQQYWLTCAHMPLSHVVLACAVNSSNGGCDGALGLGLHS